MINQNASEEVEKSATAKRLIQPEDLREFVLVSEPQISPRGDQILMTRKHEGEKNQKVSNLWLWEETTGQARQFTSGGHDSHPLWSPDGERAAFLSSRTEGHSQVYLISRTGGEALPLTRFPEGKIETYRWSPDGKTLAVKFRETEPEWTTAAKEERTRNGDSDPPRVIDNLYYRLDGDGYFNAQRYHLYLVDVETGDHRLIFNQDQLGWFVFDWSPDSKELVLAANLSNEPLIDNWKTEIYRLEVATGELRQIPDLPLGTKTAVAWSPDGQWIVFACRLGKELWGVKNSRLFVCTPEGKELRELTQAQDYCLGAVTLSDAAEVSFTIFVRWHPNSREVLMTFGWQGETQVFSATLEGEVKARTRGKHTCLLGSVSQDGSRWAITVGDPSHLPEIARGTVTPDGEVEIERVTNFNESLLKSRELAPVTSAWIDSEAGNRVQVWIVRPPHRTPGEKGPAVLQIHGGPHTQYGEVFFHEFQVLAAQGYTVFYSNPRGSKGYGEAHTAAIEGTWGGADWRDIQAVMEFMKRDPEVDPDRMGVMGGSYGGYLTNWVIGHTTDFAAAITDRCVSNLISKAGSGDITLTPGNYWKHHPWEDIRDLWEQSPIRHFGNVKTPTMVIHSEGDLRCNIEQGEQVFAALKKLGVPTRFVRYPRSTSHGMSRSGPADLRIHRLKQILEWWERWLR